VEEHHRGVAEWIIGFIADFSRNGCSRAQTEYQIFRFETRADDNRGREVFVLLIHLGKVAAVTGNKEVFTGRDICEGKSTFLVCDFDAARIEGGGRTGRGRNIHGDRRASEWLAADGVHDSATDSKGRRR